MIMSTVYIMSTDFIVLVSGLLCWQEPKLPYHYMELEPQPPDSHDQQDWPLLMLSKHHMMDLEGSGSL